MTEQEKEKVLHGLDSCGFCDGVPNICEVTECPYRGNKGWCVHELAHDAGMLISEMMKENEAVEPKIIDTSNSKLYHNNMFKNHYCGNCGEFLHVVNRRDMFCSQCGRKVKWE